MATGDGVWCAMVRGDGERGVRYLERCNDERGGCVVCNGDMIEQSGFVVPEDGLELEANGEMIEQSGFVGPKDGLELETNGEK